MRAQSREQAEALLARTQLLEDLQREALNELGELRALRQQVAEVHSRIIDPAGTFPRDLRDLTETQAALLNWASSHLGYASQAGRWINQPCAVEYRSGAVRHALTNERLLEVPFVLSTVLGMGVRNLVDVGCCESLVPLHLSAMGLRIVGLDPRPYGFEHPNLTSVQERIEHFQTDERFDMVLFLSTIEHIGVGAYGQAPDDTDDVQAIAAARRLLRPGGHIVLTLPYGRAGVNEFERTYDRDGLVALCEGGTISRTIVGVKASDTVWTWEADDLVDVDDDRLRVAMVVVRYDS